MFTFACNMPGSLSMCKALTVSSNSGTEEKSPDSSVSAVNLNVAVNSFGGIDKFSNMQICSRCMYFVTFVA